MVPLNFLRMLILVFLQALVINAEEKWVWHSSARDRYNNANRKLGNIDDNRYSVRESTTRIPLPSKEFLDEFENGNPRNDNNDPFSSNRAQFPIGPGYQPLIPGYPVLYPYPPGTFGYPGSNFGQPPPGPKGILVGPDGPTGIIGRPNRIGAYSPPRGNPANGILVGPGGPTGIIGRPPPPLYPVPGLNPLPDGYPPYNNFSPEEPFADDDDCDECEDRAFKKKSKYANKNTNRNILKKSVNDKIA